MTRKRLPDFLIIGAMKSGTSTLQVQLADQDGVFMTTPKEPNFFSDDDIWAKGMGWYQGLFDEAGEGDLLGEASTHYTKLPTHADVLQRMEGVIEAPRLIYMIRNPVARAVSHYIHEWTMGVMGDDAIAEFSRHEVLRDYGCYAMQIAPWIARYGADAVLLTSLEQVKADPGGELARIGAHIGHPGPLVWKEEIGAQNVSAERSRKLPFHNLIVDSKIATVLRQTLVPKAVRTKIREARMMKTRPELPDDLTRDLEAAFLKDREALAKLFPDHPALDLCYPFAKGQSTPTGDAA